jgi:hypothetical protein
MFREETLSESPAATTRRQGILAPCSDVSGKGESVKDAPVW